MKIFIVDDDCEQRLIMADFLDNPEDTVEEFSDGQAMLAALEQTTPDLILLDVEMPELDGISACRVLRERGHDRIQVIFISAHDEMPTRLAAYGAGGSDFVVKPFMPVDLLAKVDVARGLMAREASFASHLQFANATALTAMSSMAELGVVLQFFRQSFGCDTPAALAALFFSTLSDYGLSGMLQVRQGTMHLNYAAQGGECSPLEASILEHATQLERIFQFKSQLAINYPHITFVISNLPEEEERIGRLKDHLAALAEGMEARVLAFMAEAERQQRAILILKQVNVLMKTLSLVDEAQTAHRLDHLALGSRYLDELTQAFVWLDLTEKQEAKLYEMAHQMIERTSDVINEDHDISAQLKSVADELRGLV